MDQLTAVFERTDDWWIAYVEELPGVNTQGRTLEEARENLHEAAELVLAANRELVQRGGKAYRVSDIRVARDRSSGRGGRSG